MMFLNSSGIISITDSILKSLQTFWVEKAYKLFFPSSRISARYIPNYFVLLGAHVFEHVHPFASLLVKSQTKFTSKSRNKQATRTLKWQEIVNCWLLIHDATWEGNGNAEVYCVVSMNICCVKLTENFGLNQALLSPPGGYLEASLSPGFITWSYPFNLESFLAQGSYYQISKKEVKSL
jgi:hypothetical protein